MTKGTSGALLGWLVCAVVVATPSETAPTDGFVAMPDGARIHYVEAFGSDSVSGFVLVDSPVSAGSAELDLRKESSKNELFLLDIYAEHPKEYSEGMMHAIFRRPLPAAEFERLVGDSLLTPTSVGIAMLVADLFGVDRRPSLAKFRKPVLVIAAEGSELLDAQKEMARALPRARFETFADAGHAVFADQPKRFDDLVEGFLREIGGTPRPKP